jgi:uncharacterized domain HDIG
MESLTIDFSKSDIAFALTQTMIENSPVGYVIMDKNYRVHYANRYFLKLRNIESRSIKGSFCYSLWGYDRPCPGCATMETIKTAQRNFAFHKDVLSDDTTRYIEEYSIPLLDDNGEFEYILVILINRTNEILMRENNNQVFMKNIELLASILDKKDSYTSTHSQNVTEISIKIARHIGLSNDDIHDVRLASLLHDIGKLYIRDHIINKPHSLSLDEQVEMTRHVTETYNLLNSLTFFDTIKEMAGAHHERWDGLGYPGTKKGEEIPLGARIIAIADTYDAMTSVRPYRKTISHKEALDEISANAGSQFDPHLALGFAEMCRESYPSRAALIKKTQDGNFYRLDTRVSAVRRLKVDDNTERNPNTDKNVDDLLSTDRFLKRIIDNTPAYYLIIDEELRILYASDNFAANIGIPKEKLRTMRCHDIDGDSLNCFSIVDGEVVCPIVRALKKQTPQRGFISGRFRRDPDYCEVFAIPITIMDKKGQPISCALEILFDLSREMAERQAMNSDIKVLLNNVYGLVSGLDATSTLKADEILRDCHNFNQYLNEMKSLLEEKAGTVSRRIVRPKKKTDRDSSAAS